MKMLSGSASCFDGRVSVRDGIGIKNGTNATRVIDAANIARIVRINFFIGISPGYKKFSGNGVISSTIYIILLIIH
jgi:hypothetical protein